MIKQRSLLKLILLSLITCGIYGIFFWWGYVNDINDACVCDGKKSPNFIIVVLLSVITCGLYYLIWLYKQGDRLQVIAPEYGLNFKEGGGTVVLLNLAGSAVSGLSSSVASAVYAFSGIGGAASVSMASKVLNPADLTDLMIKWGITTDLLYLLTFLSLVLLIVGISLSLNALGILIKNLNAIGKVYNEKCL
jgi:hypothetical protein